MKGFGVLPRAVVFFLPLVFFAQPQTSDLADAIRKNDLRTLKGGLQKPGAANARDSKGVPLLMHAAAFGSPEAMRMLLEAGADVNAKNSFDATALMWAAGDPVKARMLLEHGADVNAKSKQERTPLLIAAAHPGGAETVRRLLEKGADVQFKDKMGNTAVELAAMGGDVETVRLLLEKGAPADAADMGGSTPISFAAGNCDLPAVKLLLSKGADVNRANKFSGAVKFGPIAMTGVTPLMWAAPFCPAPVIKTLLDAGAQVNAKDGRGMTPLMFAVASETQDLAVVRLLLAAGADVNVKSGAGETALDWALKSNESNVVGALRAAGAKTAVVHTPPQRKVAAEPPSLTGSVDKSVALLQRTSSEFFKQSGCVGCHHQPITSFAVAAAHEAGNRVDEAAWRELVDTIKFGLSAMQEGFLQRIDGPAGPDIMTASLLGLAAAGYKPDLLTDSVVVNVASQQRTNGSWFLSGVTRAPMEESNIARTANGVRVLKIYGPPGRKAEFAQRIERARKWLTEAKPKTTDEYAMRLLGLAWSGAAKAEVESAAREVMSLQRPDGGWAQNANLASDAFATGESLYALRESGSIAVADAVYDRGVRFLLGTQFADGSWYVRSRAVKFQPYFQSGFPYDHDQWISSTATGWAVAALAPAARLQRAGR